MVVQPIGREQAIAPTIFRSLVLMPSQMLCAREFADEHLGFVNQHRQTLRTNVRLPVAMFDGDEGHLVKRSFTVHTLFWILIVVHFFGFTF